MKSLFYSLLLCLTTVCASGYEFMIFSDLHYTHKKHYENFDIHSDAVKKHWLKRQEIWEKYVAADFLPDAAARFPKTQFVFQLGDLVDGSYGTTERHAEAMNTALDEIKRHFPGKRIYSVIGNHDTWGKGFREALEQVIGKERNSWFLYDGDLFILSDSNPTQMDFVREALNSNPDARHVFFFSHHPILPAGTAHEVRNVVFAGQPEFRKEMLDLLCKRNAIFICGHLHNNSVVNYVSPDGKGSFTQVMISSTLPGERINFTSVIQPLQIEEFAADQSLQNMYLRFPGSDAIVKPMFETMNNLMFIHPFCGYGLIQVYPNNGVVVLKIGLWVKNKEIVTIQLRPPTPRKTN